MENGKIALALLLIVVMLLAIAAGATSPSANYHRSSNSYSNYNAYRPSATPKPTVRPVQKSTTSQGSSRRDITPGPSTDGFYHPEDFYDWNRDDFSDYEEAEEYYYEHGGY